MSTATLNFTTASQGGGGTQAWSNLSAAYGSNTSTPATSSSSTFGSFNTEVLTLGGIAGTTIPAGAVIDGIELQGVGWSVDGSSNSFVSAVLTINGTASGNLATDLNGGTTPFQHTTPTSCSSGGSNTTPSGLGSIGESDLNSGSITLALEVSISASGPETVKTCSWDILVTYTIIVIDGPPPPIAVRGVVNPHGIRAGAISGPSSSSARRTLPGNQSPMPRPVLTPAAYVARD